MVSQRSHLPEISLDKHLVASDGRSSSFWNCLIAWKEKKNFSQQTPRMVIMYLAQTIYNEKLRVVLKYQFPRLKLNRYSPMIIKRTAYNHKQVNFAVKAA